MSSPVAKEEKKTFKKRTSAPLTPKETKEEKEKSNVLVYTGVGDNKGRDPNEKWPLGRRSASVVLKLETIEIGNRVYDLKGNTTLKTRQGKYR